MGKHNGHKFAKSTWKRNVKNPRNLLAQISIDNLHNVSFTLNASQNHVGTPFFRQSFVCCMQLLPLWLLDMVCTPNSKPILKDLFPNQGGVISNAVVLEEESCRQASLKGCSASSRQMDAEACDEQTYPDHLIARCRLAI